VLPTLARRVGGFCYLASAAAALAAVAAVIVGPDWVERVSGWSPDGGSGALESALVVLPLIAAAILALAGHSLRSSASLKGAPPRVG
jgi:hypothetical protein